MLTYTANGIWDVIPQDAQEWLARNYTTLLRIGLIVVLATLLNRFVSKLLRRLVERTVRPDMHQSSKDRLKRIDTLHGIAVAIFRLGVWVLAILQAISLLGVNTAPLFASAGLIGAALAFGAQSLVKDFLSGLFIIYENQYRVGDYIELAEVSGTVETIGLRTTVLRDLNGSVHHVPNGSIVVTTNRSMGQGKINLDISVDAATDISLLEHIINHVGERLAASTTYKNDIINAPKFDRITDYANNAVTIKVLGTTESGAQLQVKSALLAALKKDFDEHKIKLAVLPAAAQPAKKKR